MGLRVISVVVASLILAACGGGGDNSSPIVSDINVGQIAFGQILPITLSGRNLDQEDGSISVQVSGCQGLALSSVVTNERVQLTCIPSTVGSITVSALLASGDVLAKKEFFVPPPHVTFDTNLGSIVVELKPLEAFNTVVNFLSYLHSGAYDNVIFHRVVANFVAQSGAITTDNLLIPTQAPIPLESNNGLFNVAGTLGMARLNSPVDSATSEFYFNLKDNFELNYVSEEVPGYAVFGEIISGLAVLNEIGNVQVQDAGGGLTHLPISPVVINSVRQTQ